MTTTRTELIQAAKLSNWRGPPQISWGKPSFLPRTSAGFTVTALDGYGLCEILPARPAVAASYPVAVRRIASSLHASFRRSLAVPPLRFARASPPSGCTGDFHPQAAEPAQHTGRCAPLRGRLTCGEAILDRPCARHHCAWQVGSGKWSCQSHQEMPVGDTAPPSDKTATSGHMMCYLNRPT